MPKDLAQILADAREDLVVLDRNGVKALPLERFTQLLDAVAQAGELHMRMLVESDARIWSGRSVEWLRGLFPELERAGDAFKRGNLRFYRACRLPRRVDVQAAREAGRRAAAEVDRAS